MDHNNTDNCRKSEENNKIKVIILSMLNRAGNGHKVELYGMEEISSEVEK